MHTCTHTHLSISISIDIYIYIRSIPRPACRVAVWPGWSATSWRYIFVYTHTHIYLSIYLSIYIYNHLLLGLDLHTSTGMYSGRMAGLECDILARIQSPGWPAESRQT